MQDTVKQDGSSEACSVILTERELAPVLRVSVAFLQKDRLGPKRIPFIRLGDRCLYDKAEVMAAVKAMSIGGLTPRRPRRKSESGT
jgi:hypothetical protein